MREIGAGQGCASPMVARDTLGGAVGGSSRFVLQQPDLLRCTGTRRRATRARDSFRSFDDGVTKAGPRCCPRRKFQRRSPRRKNQWRSPFVQDASICTVAHCRQCRLTGMRVQKPIKKSLGKRRTDILSKSVLRASSKGPVQAQMNCNSS